MRDVQNGRGWKEIESNERRGRGWKGRGWKEREEKEGDVEDKEKEGLKEKMWN